jgi:hypothetical protein
MTSFAILTTYVLSDDYQKPFDDFMTFVWLLGGSEENHEIAQSQ